jgi:predicted RNase H-like HicB family nuclease
MMWGTIEVDKEDDGRFIAAIPEMPGVMVYGATEAEALALVFRLAASVVEDKATHGEPLK